MRTPKSKNLRLSCPLCYVYVYLVITPPREERDDLLLRFRLLKHLEDEHQVRGAMQQGGVMRRAKVEQAN